MVAQKHCTKTTPYPNPKTMNVIWKHLKIPLLHFCLSCYGDLTISYELFQVIMRVCLCFWVCNCVWYLSITQRLEHNICACNSSGLTIYLLLPGVVSLQISDWTDGKCSGTPPADEFGVMSLWSKLSVFKKRVIIAGYHSHLLWKKKTLSFLKRIADIWVCRRNSSGAS